MMKCPKNTKVFIAGAGTGTVIENLGRMLLVQYKNRLEWVDTVFVEVQECIQV